MVLILLLEGFLLLTDVETVVLNGVPNDPEISAQHPATHPGIPFSVLDELHSLQDLFSSNVQGTVTLGNKMMSCMSKGTW